MKKNRLTLNIWTGVLDVVNCVLFAIAMPVIVSSAFSDAFSGENTTDGLIAFFYIMAWLGVGLNIWALIQSKKHYISLVGPILGIIGSALFGITASLALPAIIVLIIAAVFTFLQHPAPNAPSVENSDQVQGDHPATDKQKSNKTLLWSILGGVAIVIVVIFAVGAIGGSDSPNHASNGSATGHNTSAKSNDSSTFKYDYKTYDIADKKKYDVNYSDNSWVADIHIDKIEVLKTTKEYEYQSINDGEFNLQGFVRIHLSITPSKDVNIYPTLGTVVYNNGEQHTANSDGWDGEIASGATKDGWVTVPVKSLSNVSDLNNIRFKFSGDYDTDDYEDDNSNHDYDMTLELN